MDKSREEKIAGILNLEVTNLKSDLWYILPWGQMIKSGELLEELKSPEGQLIIRQRINELLDELELTYSHNRLPVFISKSGLKAEEHHNISIQPSATAPNGKTDWVSGWFIDSELPEKEQDLLLWLAEKGVEKCK